VGGKAFVVAGAAAVAGDPGQGPLVRTNLIRVGYYGVDIVPPVIEQNWSRFGGPHRHFAVADLTCNSLPRPDAILCRDTLVHVSYQDAARILANFTTTGASWLLLNTYPEVTSNRNQFSGQRWRRLNFRLKPFEFPAPVETVPEGGDMDPSQLVCRA
jgi:hypothetical protein